MDAGISREQIDAVKGVFRRWTQDPVSLRCLVSVVILAPVLEGDSRTHLICEEDMTDRLLAELSIQRLDLVLTDAPIAGSVKVKAFNHFLGECGVTFFAAPKLARSLKGKFPAMLDGAPFLAPTENTMLRRSLEHWFGARELIPRIIAEFGR